MITSRRNFLIGIGAALAAPAVIRTPGLLMPVRRIHNPVLIKNMRMFVEKIEFPNAWDSMIVGLRDPIVTMVEVGSAFDGQPFRYEMQVKGIMAQPGDIIDVDVPYKELLEGK